MSKVHYVNTRLFVNAGMEIPECKAYAKLLDVDSGYWEKNKDITKVTCKNCLKIFNKRKKTS